MDYIDDYIFDEPLVLMAEDGGYFDQAASRPICHRLDGPAWVNNHAHIIRPTGADRDYFYYWFVHRDITPSIKGGTRSKLNQADLKRLTIWLPPLDEQRRIVEVLRSLDDAHRLHLETLEHLHLLRKLALRDLFTSSGEGHVSDDVLGALPADWKAMPAEELCEAVIDCKNRTPPITDDGYAVVRTPNVRGGRFVRDNLFRTDATSFEEWTKRGAPRTGDVLITREAPIGEVCLVPEDEPVCLGQRMMLYRPDPRKLDSLFLLYALQSQPVQDHLRNLGGGSTVGHVRVGDIRSLPIPFPNMPTQKGIAKTLAEIDEAIDLAGETARGIGNLKTSLMDDLLSGRVRVPSHADALPRPSVQPAFKRAVFAAEIVHQLHDDFRFGSVKHEKIVHLCELHIGLQEDLARHAYKEAAGPYDPKARRSVETIFRQQKWFNAAKPDGKRVVYQPLANCGAHAPYFQRYFGDRQAEVQTLIDLLRPMSTQQCEIVATLYAVWNDFLIDGREASDDEIVASVLNDWHSSKAQIAEDRWLAALPWMRKHCLVPKGLGEKTRVVAK